MNKHQIYSNTSWLVFALYPKAQKLLLLGSLCAVLGTALVTIGNTLCIKGTANDVITYTGQVTNSSASDKNYRVLLKVVSDSGNVSCCIKSVGKSYSCDLSERGVRLLRAGSRYLGSNASLLRRRLIGCYVIERVKALLKYGCFRLVNLILTSLLDKLIKGWHSSFFPPSL